MTVTTPRRCVQYPPSLTQTWVVECSDHHSTPVRHLRHPTHAPGPGPGSPNTYARDARIAELTALLEESRRAGKRQAAPFSKRAPKENPARPGRKPGKGHGRHGHRMVPGKVDRDLDALLPGACPGCGGELVEDDEPAFQFQTELPEPRPVVTRFRVHRGHCRACGRRVQGRHLEQTSDALGAASSQVGPRAKGWAIVLHYSMGLSFGRTAQVLSLLGGIEVTRGAICQASRSAGVDLGPTHEAIKSTLAGQASVTMDETRWRMGGWGAWLWVAASEEVTVYDVAWGRGFAEATNLLPANYQGVLVRDGWAAYHRYEQAEHQTCLAHFGRRAHEMEQDNPEEVKETPRIVSLLLKKALDTRDLPAAKRKSAVKELSELVEVLGETPQPYDPNRRLVNHLVAEHHRGALLTFLSHPGVDATNWKGETGVRPAVVNRKVWGGNRTEDGAVIQGRIMTFLRTATQQGADAIELLVNLARAPVPAVVTGLRLGTPQRGP
ncbi:MAG: IS66 family transposase [Acidimicrobiales bacterium]